MVKNESDKKFKMMIKRWKKIFITFEINHAKRMTVLTGKYYPFPSKEIATIRDIFS